MWSYSGNPADSDLDALRFLVGDTDEDTPLIQDEEIDYILTLFPTTSGMANYKAAAVISRQIAAYYGKKMTKTVGSLSLQWGERYRNYLELAKMFEELDNNPSYGNGSIAAPVLFGGGPTYLGTDDSPTHYQDTGVPDVTTVDDV